MPPHVRAMRQVDASAFDVGPLQNRAEQFQEFLKVEMLILRFDRVKQAGIEQITFMPDGNLFFFVHRII